MSLDTLNSLASRASFFVAFVCLGFAVLEWVVNIFGYTILRGTYSAGRMLEFAAVFMVFVMTLLLRQLREELRKRNS